MFSITVELLTKSFVTVSHGKNIFFRWHKIAQCVSDSDYGAGLQAYYH